MQIWPTYERTATSQFVVSWWNIPGGCNYHDAAPVCAFVDTEEEAKKLVRQMGEMPPEMADYITVKQHDCIEAKIKNRK